MCGHKLYLRLEKCEFEKTKIEYLGFIISHNKVEMDPVKIAGVVDWPMPSNKKKVQSFVGFVNFYRRFIPGFSHHVRALFDLTMKDVRFIWGLPQDDFFMKRCNVPHKPDLRTANYAPEFPLSVITAAAVFTVSTAAIFTVSTAAISTASATITTAVIYVTAAAFTVIATAASIITVTATAVFIASIAITVFTATAAASVSSASASNRSPHSVNSVRPWSYHPLAPFPQSVTNT
jgi:hypothetical protein